MLKVSIESKIDNIVIKDNELIFTDTVNGQAVYTYKPCSHYRYDTDSYNESMMFLFHPDYLGFYSTLNIHNFTIAVLDNVKKLNFNFKYNGLTVNVSNIDDRDFTVTD